MAVDMDALSVNDGLQFDSSAMNWNAIYRKPDREFQRYGMEVEEWILPLTKGHKKLLWVRKPLIHLIVDGRPNPCAHVDFDAAIPGAEEAARQRVEEGFDRYHLYGEPHIEWEGMSLADQPIILESKQ